MKELTDCTVLIVDDEPVNLEVLSKTLHPHFKTAVAHNGPTALEMANANPPDLILLDIMMPEMDGYEVCSTLKNNPATKDIPIIFITALTEDSNEIKCFEAGAVDFVKKPFMPVVVRSRVETHLKLKQSQRELKGLYEQTLLGSVRVLSDVLALANKTAFGQTHNIRRLTKGIAKEMKQPNLWKYDLAAQFSHLGCISIPGDELHNICMQKGEVSDEARQQFNEHPDRAADLIGRIPRLEDVATMLAGQRTPHNPEDGDHIPSQILRTAVDFSCMVLKGMNETDAMTVLKGSVTPYNPDVVASLENYLSTEAESIGVFALPPDQVTPGMVLDEDVYSSSGVFVAAKGMEVDNSVLRILQRLTRSDEERVVRVRAPKK